MITLEDWITLWYGQLTSEVVIPERFPQLWIANNGFHNVMPRPDGFL